MTSAEVEVEAALVWVKLEVLLEDLVLFHQLKPSGEARYSVEDLIQASERHRTFILEKLALFDGTGQRLSGAIDLGASLEIDDGFVAQEALMEERVVYELRYPLSKPLQYLTVVQRFGSEELNLPSIMDLSVRQGERWLHRPSQLMKDQALTLSINEVEESIEGESQWERLKRQKQEEVQRRLGISSYSALYSFVYVTKREVRHEVLVPLLTFEEWLPIERRRPDFLTVAEQAASVDAIRAFFHERAPISINGSQVRPDLDRVQFFGVDIRDFAMDAVPRDVSAYQARLGLILRYDLEEEPRRVKLPWNIYGEHASAVQSTVYVRNEAPQRVRFWKGGAAWEWEADDMDQSLKDADDLLGQPLGEVSSVPTVRLWRIPLPSLLLFVIAGMGWVGVRRNWNGGRRGPIPLAILSAGIAAVVCWPWGRVTMVAPWRAYEFEVQTEGRRVGEQLIRRAYSAFEETSELGAYEILSRAVEGELLEELYLALKRGLVFQEQGGAVADVSRVDLDQYEASGIEIDDRGRIRFQFRGTWEVQGSVEHWGHRHERRHRYTARVGVLGSEAGWRFDQLEVLNEERSEISTSIR